jgi:hypothetical protein
MEKFLSRDKKNTAAGPLAVVLSDWGRPEAREVTAAQWKEALARLRAS